MPLLFLCLATLTIPSPPRIDTLRIPVDASNAGIAERYRLDPAEVRFAVRKKFDLTENRVEILEIAFPSSVASRHVENDTVFAEYFRPWNAEKRPAVLVLDILDGAGAVSRAQAVWLAANDIPALCITMPYYGRRRPPESTAGKLRFLSPDIASSRANVRQGILDARRAVAWLATRPEVDPTKLGVVGTSLGSFLGSILAANEPKLSHASLLLGGGGLVDSYADHPQAGAATASLKAAGMTPEALKEALASVDPLTFAATLKTKRLLLIGATRDDVVPPSALKRLWEATDKPPILWVDATHVGAAAHLFPMMSAVRKHIEAAR